MLDLPIAAASVAVLLVVLALASRAARQARVVRSVGPGDGLLSASPPHVTAIIPARNEAAAIGACVTSMLAQSYPGDRLRLCIVDDESDDDTAGHAAQAADGDARVAIHAAGRLPAGWTGKGHACWLGSRRAADSAEWLCFLDADVVAHPDLLRAAVATAERDRLDLLSLAPRQILVGPAERLILPCGFYLLGFCQDLRRTEVPGNGEAAATGMFMLVRRRAYEAAGGHRASRDAISEDTALAGAVKHAGGSVAMRLGDRLLATRMYEDLASLRVGIGKNLVDMLGGPVATACAAIAAVVLAWVVVLLPAAALATGPVALRLTAITAAFGAALVAFGFHVAGARHFGIPPWYGLLFPLGYTAGALIALDSIRRRTTGRVVWKGRTYPAPRSGADPAGGD